MKGNANMNKRKVFEIIVQENRGFRNGPVSLTELWESNRGPKTRPGVRSVSTGQVQKWELYREIKAAHPDLEQADIFEKVSALYEKRFGFKGAR